MLPPGLAFPPALLPGVSFAGGTMGTGEEGTGRGEGGTAVGGPLRPFGEGAPASDAGRE